MTFSYVFVLAGAARVRSGFWLWSELPANDRPRRKLLLEKRLMDTSKNVLILFVEGADLGKLQAMLRCGEKCTGQTILITKNRSLLSPGPDNPLIAEFQRAVAGLVVSGISDFHPRMDHRYMVVFDNATPSVQLATVLTRFGRSKHDWVEVYEHAPGSSTFLPLC